VASSLRFAIAACPKLADYVEKLFSCDAGYSLIQSLH
jgi:hypothetical protein